MVYSVQKPQARTSTTSSATRKPATTTRRRYSSPTRRTTTARKPVTTRRYSQTTNVRAGSANQSRENISDIGNELTSRYVSFSIRGPQTEEEIQNCRAWEAQKAASKSRSDRLGELADELIEAKLRGDHAREKQIYAEMARVNEVPRNREEMIQGFKKSDEEREIFLAGVMGMSRNEAKGYMNRIRNTQEAEDARQQVQDRLDDFYERFNSIA